MAKGQKTAITPTREENFPEWYQEVVKAADMAENSAVRGCMIIKPHGYALWERVQQELDARIKREGVRNAYFPLLIPLSYISREAEHIDGFAKECAVVTHHRLEQDKEKGGLKPSGELQEPYVIRPTSETIIGESMAKWIQSYRDLPMKLNQWANVMRWEMRPRVFLRTSEFLWQEGHNAFASAVESRADALRMLDVYADVAENVLGVPVIKGEKTPEERFPGAIATYTIEAMMQDGKAVQYATSHDLGQTFSKSCNITYQDRDGKEHYAHTTSWGMSTRTIGGLVMVHGDDDGLILPPSIAPEQVVIVPIIKDESQKADLLTYCLELEMRLIEQGVRVKLDSSDARIPDKMWGNIKRGTPVRVEIGPREMEEAMLTYVMRHKGPKEKVSETRDAFVSNIASLLAEMQSSLLEGKRKEMMDRILDVSSVEEAREVFDKGHMGFVRMDYSLAKGDAYTKLENVHALSARCLPFENDGEKVLIGKSY